MQFMQLPKSSGKTVLKKWRFLPFWGKTLKHNRSAVKENQDNFFSIFGKTFYPAIRQQKRHSLRLCRFCNIPISFSKLPYRPSGPSFSLTVYAQNTANTGCRQSDAHLHCLGCIQGKMHNCQRNSGQNQIIQKARQETAQQAFLSYDPG